MPRIKPGPPCNVCGEPSVAKNLCQKHYKRWMRNGHTEQTRPADWGSKEKHPLYGRWCWAKRDGGRIEAWDDFWAFVQDVGDPPNENSALRRCAPSKPWSPENCYWTEQRPNENKASAARRWREQNPAKTRDTDLKRMYGITLEQWQEMFDNQDGRCAVCGKEESAVHHSGKRRNLAVDHCHDTGIVRGLLCTECNRGIGSFRDNIEFLENAIRYLRPT